MTTTEERVSRLEGAYDQVNERLGDINRSIEAMGIELNNRINETNNRINGLYVLIFGSWVTTVLAIIGLYFRG